MACAYASNPYGALCAVLWTVGMPKSALKMTIDTNVNAFHAPGAIIDLFTIVIHVVSFPCN